MILESATNTNTNINLPEAFQLDKEECELDLSNKEEAKIFLESAENLYADAIRCELVARTEGYERLQMPDVAGEEVFQIMNQIMTELRTSIKLAEHTSFTELQIVKLQSLYNDLETVSDHIINEYESVQKNLNIKKLEVSSEKKVGPSWNEAFGRLQRSDLNIDVNEEDGVQELEIAIKSNTTPTSNVSIDSNMVGQLSSELREADPIVRTIPLPSPGIMKPSEDLEERSLTGQYLLREEGYKNFIDKNYSSAAAFERFMDMKITQFEAKSIDVFERWLGEEFQSPFVFLQDKSVAEVVALSQSQDVRKIMADNQIKYESFVAWIDFIEKIQTEVELDSNRPFGELVARWFIEESQASRSHIST